MLAHGTDKNAREHVEGRITAANIRPSVKRTRGGGMSRGTRGRRQFVANGGDALPSARLTSIDSGS